MSHHELTISVKLHSKPVFLPSSHVFVVDCGVAGHTYWQHDEIKRVGHQV